MRFFAARRTSGVVLILVTMFITAASACAQESAKADATPPPPCSKAPNNVFWWVFGAMTGIVFGLFVIVFAGLLHNKDWRLGDALSEEAGNQPNPLPVGTKPVMVASSSRLIALLGLLVILVMFLGFGYYIMYAALNCDFYYVDVGKIMEFLFSGAVMFAPYLANQLQTAFSTFTK